MKKLFLNQKPLTLDPANLIQSGGEGMVFGTGQQAVKIYHRPQSGRVEKLQLLISSQLSRTFPTNVLGPYQLVLDEDQQLAGFTMPRLPRDSHIARKLSDPNFCHANIPGVRPAVGLLLDIHRTLERLHQLGFIVGDLNDHNIHFAMPADMDWPSYWIDVDSFQLGTHVCPVAMKTFLDPHLYDVADFSSRPWFSQASDWYAYFVLLVKSLLLAHPYGGTHVQHKSLEARAMDGISLIHPSVIYPKLARPIETLPDDLLHHMTLVFEEGLRPPFPVQLLTEYATNLHHCSHCGLDYPKSRPGCPGCRRQTPAPSPALIQGRLRLTRLLNTEDHILQVNVEADGRIQVITRAGNTFELTSLSSSGKKRKQTLFSGRQRYRFAFFGSHYLAINPVRSRQLLLLDVSKEPVKEVALIETALFRDQAVFACSKNFVFRQVQGLIMRGEIRDGLYVEETVASARREQTWLWASSIGDQISGYYRFFDEHHFFLVAKNGANYQIEVPFLAAGGSIRDVVGLFSHKEVAFLAKIFQNGLHHVGAVILDQQGQLLRSFQLDASEMALSAELDGKALYRTTLLWATDEGILKHWHNGQSILADTAGFVSQGDLVHYHPEGLLIQQNSALLMVSELKAPQAATSVR